MSEAAPEASIECEAPDREGAGVVAGAMSVEDSISPAPEIQQTKEVPELSSPNLSDLMSPVPKSCGVVQCYIRRNKGLLFSTYSLFLQEGDVFLMASRKRPMNKTSNYLISMDQSDLNRASSSYLGKLRSNDSGTEFRMFDSGINPKYHKGDEGLKDNAEEGTSGNISVTPVRCEMGFVRYSADALGSRQLVVALPGRNAFCYLINKPPRWNEQLKAHVLNFGGRITVASVYNFQLVEKEEKSTVVLQFGATVGKDKFAMDLRWPISPFQAFALSLSSFDTLVSKADI